MFSPLRANDEGPMDDDYPLAAILGSQRFHSGSGTRTGHSKRINDFDLKGEVSLSVKDGARLHVKSGDTVHVQSREGTLTREARIDEGLMEGRVFVPTAFHANDAMNLVGLTALGHGQPQGLKTCQVRVEKLGGSK